MRVQGICCSVSYDLLQYLFCTDAYKKNKSVWTVRSFLSSSSMLWVTVIFFSLCYSFSFVPYYHIANISVPYPWHFGTNLNADPDHRIRLRILLVSSVTFNVFYAYSFLKVLLHHFSKIRKIKKSHKTIEIYFFLNFFLLMEGSGSGSVQIN